MWKGGIAAQTDERRPDFLAYESSARRWCLVLKPPATEFEWSVHARLALEEASKDFGNLNVEPLVLSADDALDGEAAIRGAVRALCAADVVIADVTRYDPCLLFLLGIRAAVRRSVTIACTQQDLSADLRKDLPFNLKELNLVSFHEQKRGHFDLVKALLAGLTESHTSTRYLDLPVYDYVREDAADDAPRPSPSVLFLRAFENYSAARELFVQRRVRQALRLPNARLKAVIDQTSPRLAGQRLYEAIRHWNACVVDLTWWRANVLFELGVRLAVRPAGTYCLIDKSVAGDTTFEGSRAKLNALLQPASYKASTNTFPQALAAPERAIYETAVRHFRRAQDRYGEQVDVMLVRADAIMRSHSDPLQKVDPSPLYARDNDAYHAEVQHSVFEQLCAAWYYLADRERLYATRPIDLLEPRRAEAFRRFRRLGSRLKAVLAHRYEERDLRLRRRIEATERRAAKSGATKMADLLDAWGTLRGDPPWQIDLATVPADDRKAQIDDWKFQLEQLLALEERLQQLASPVCELPLQSIRSDRARLQIVLTNSEGGLS